MTMSLQSSRLSQIASIKHAFYTRLGGVSSGIFTSLNAGFASGDDASAVRGNRAVICRDLGLEPTRLVNCFQVHSADVVCVQGPAGERDPRADGMITRASSLGLAVTAADCAPILAADQAGTICAAIHVGWKGAVNGMCNSLASAFEAAGVPAREVVAAIGPCIQLESYEVGDEMRDGFLSKHADAARFFSNNFPGKRWHLDLPGFLESALYAVGIVNVDVLRQDTYSRPDIFFSARRAQHSNEPGYGRMMSVIAIQVDA